MVNAKWRAGISTRVSIISMLKEHVLKIVCELRHIRAGKEIASDIKQGIRMV